MKTLARAWSIAASLLVGVACNTDQATEAAKKTADASKKAADAAIESTQEVIDDGKKTAKELGDEATARKQKIEALYAKVTDTGELSDSATRWIEAQAKEQAEKQGGTIETVIVTGTQVAPVALEVSKVLNDAVQTDTAIEPIYQKIEGDTETVDAAIENMPRVEVVDGVTVGFRQLDTLDTDKAVKERAYLVTWRREDHLVGFVYRSTRTIDLDKLVAETPRLMKLTRAALEASG